MPRASAGAGAVTAAAPTAPTVARTANVFLIIMLTLLSDFRGQRRVPMMVAMEQGTARRPWSQNFLLTIGTKFAQGAFGLRWRGKNTSDPVGVRERIPAGSSVFRIEFA